MSPTPVNGSTTPISEAERELVLNPDAVVADDQETFVFGKNPDGTLRKWKMQPLRWKYEKLFRKQAMPMLAATYKPFETLIATMAQPLYSDLTPSLIKAMADAENEADDYLTKCIHIILLAQDSDISLDWVEDNAEGRDQMMTIVQRQCELHKIMDRLGESLAGRLQRLASMMGLQLDLPSLKRLWKQVTADFSAKITKVVSTAPNAFGQFMENSSETLTSSSIKRQVNDAVGQVPESAFQPVAEKDLT